MIGKSMVLLRALDPFEGNITYWIGYIDLATGHFDGILNRNGHFGSFRKSKLEAPMYWWQRRYKVVRRYRKSDKELAKHFAELL